MPKSLVLIAAELQRLRRLVEPHRDPWRQLHSPLGSNDLRPLEPWVQVIQFQEPLSDDEYRAVAELALSAPHVNLRAYADYGRRFTDPDFLRFFTGIRGLQIDLPYLQNVDALNEMIRGLERFRWGWTQRKFSLAFLANASLLKRLHLEKHRKALEIVAGLTGLKHLSLRSISLEDLTIFSSLQGLQSFEYRLGGLKDISAVAAFQQLQYLELWQIRGLTDLCAIGDLRSLEYVYLQALGHVTELPSLARMSKLRRAVLHNMKGISDLGPVASAPNLEELLLQDMQHLPKDCLAPFIGHPRLKSVGAGEAALAVLPKGLKQTESWQEFLFSNKESDR